MLAAVHRAVNGHAASSLRLESRVSIRRRLSIVHWYIALLYGLLRLAGLLPLRALHAAGAALGWVLGRVDNPLRRWHEWVKPV